VKIIVDANIVFSGVLNTNGKIGDLLINSHKNFDFIAPGFLRTEIKKHHVRLAKISKLSLSQVIEAENQVCKEITFFPENKLKQSVWRNAQKLTDDVDPKDVLYVAFSKHFRCKIWSGDKSLMKGLAKKGFYNFITTDELYKLRESLLTSKK
jgi:predicted nucleic acid-binding protein